MITYEDLQRLYGLAGNMFRVECLEKELGPQDRELMHICAVKALFRSFWEQNYFSDEAIFAIVGLPQETRLYEVVVEPYLKIIDDKEMVAGKYATMYLHYFSKKLEGAEDEVAMASLFKKELRIVRGSIV